MASCRFDADEPTARPVAVGVLTGLASTYPWALGPQPSLVLWALVGTLSGLWIGRTGPILTCGIASGVALTVAFLYSRFGGAASSLPGYTIFVLAMSIVGAIGGIVTLFVGSRIRRPP